jgi:hypothetical protein
MKQPSFAALVDDLFILIDVVHTLERDLDGADLRRPEVSREAMAELRWLQRQACHLEERVTQFSSCYPSHPTTLLLNQLSDQIGREIHDLRRQVRHIAITPSSKFGARNRQQNNLSTTLCSLRLAVEQLYDFLRDLRRSEPELFAV